MKVLFISSGNIKGGISPIIYNQGESLKSKNCQIEYFTINQKGIFGYINHVFKLRNHIKSNKYDLFHAHYSLSAFVASLAGAKPLVTSLMGSDVLNKNFSRFIIRFLAKNTWKTTIVKSEEMKSILEIDSVKVIPNGVNMNLFKPMKKKESLHKLGWNSQKKHILFAGSIKRPEKNYDLFKFAVEYLNDELVEIHTLENVENSLMPILYNASDVIVLTSKHEGSPNVIKEAMACNRPIVSVNVGDVKEVIKDTEGCYITSNNAIEIANKIKNAFQFESTEGRSKIKHLNSDTIADKLFEIYNN